MILNNPVSDSVSNTFINFNAKAYSIKDLWMKKEIGTTKNAWTGIVQGHDVVMLRLTVEKPAIKKIKQKSK